ncbi:MAG TPA: thioredoxin domain-containing protein [Myxococcota bacterium]|nr:thioredoxin domain-containing protein [Myxococcota bacterium]
MKRAVFAPLAVLATLAACDGGSSSNAPEASGGAAAKTAKLELFVMSQCPYGIEVINAVGPLKEKLGDALDLKVEYIGDGAAGSLTSMHGPSEVTGDIAQLCAMKQDPSRWLGMTLCQNKAPREVGTNWKSCAQETGMDTAALTSCVEGEEGQKLAAASFDAAKARGAKGSPTIFLDGQPYSGGRKTNDFLRTICTSLGDAGPQACKDLPKPVAVSAVFLSDARCAECDIHPLEPRLKGELPGVTVQYLDYATPEGKALYDELRAADPSFRALPAALLGQEVTTDADGYATLQRFLKPLGKYQSLAIGAKWDPTAEICDNAQDDDGDGQADCADDGCKQSMTCRPNMPNKVDLFVMSQCPYGAKAMIAMQDTLGAFGSDIDLDVHFIGDEQNGQLTSMHGPSEVEEDLREICATKLAAKDNQFMKYLACRSKDYRSAEWKPCAAEAGIDAGKLEACAAGEGKDMLRESFQYAASLGIGASPTFLSNNKREFNAIAAPDIQKQICQDNPSLKGCGATVTAADPAAAAQPVPAGACGQ